MRYVDLFVACLEAVGGKPSREQLRYDVAFGINAYFKYRSAGDIGLVGSSPSVDNGARVHLKNSGISRSIESVGGETVGVACGPSVVSGDERSTETGGVGDSGVVGVGKRTRRNRAWRKRRQLKKLAEHAEEFAITHSDSELSASWKKRKLLENELAAMTITKKMESIVNSSNVSKSSVSPSSSASQPKKGVVSQDKYDALVKVLKEKEKKIKDLTSEYRLSMDSYRKKKGLESQVLQARYPDSFIKKNKKKCQEPEDFSGQQFELKYDPFLSHWAEC